MQLINKTITKLDQFQQRYHFTGFLYAVIKKYGEDQAGYQSALFTYYAFLSLFPLLLVLTTITGLLAGSHPQLQRDIIHATVSYFPGFGKQLVVGGLHKSGLALVVGIIFTFYGARGVADAFRNGVNHIWHVPITKRDGFPKSILKSLTIIVTGGLGLILAAVCSGLAAAAGHGPLFRVLPVLVNVGILFGLFSWLMNICLPQHISFKNGRSGALTAAVGLVLLQTFGTLLLSRQLKNLDAVYSYFALSLGLLFWLYLQAQVIYYSVVVAAVHTQKLWPRSLDASKLTAADKRAYALEAGEARVYLAERSKTGITS